ncbi:MAG TPA: amidohydrolase family protein [Nocardioides sp.]|nr:amidohydrolase family protein [Nocardioides sp.]
MHALKAARCFDGERFLPGGTTVLLDGERIAGVEPLAYDAPDGVAVTTYDGTLLPGLVDAHVHLVSEGRLPSEPGSLEHAARLDDAGLDSVIARTLATQAAAGVTTVRDLGDRAYRTLAARDRRTDGEPRIVAAGPPLTIPDGHCHFLGGGVAGVDAVRAAVREHVDRGVDLVKVMASGGMLTIGSDLLGVQFTPEELHAAVEETHEAGLRVVAHCHSLAGARHAVAAGVDGLEHATLLGPDGIAVPDDLIDEIAVRGLTVDPTLGYDPARVIPLDQAPPHVRAVVARVGMTPVEVTHRRAAQLARMFERGVRVVSGLDSGAAPPKPHGDLWRAVVQLLDAGVTSAQALATATSAAADDCGLRATTGRLAPGLSADLLVVDGDLERDLTALSRPRAVWVRGVPV